ncbi:MAG: aldo/keto reductase [Calditrichaeota bacterium]|nr:MAG: aldo/keto reductase [Calditrichota bacterium]
MSLTDKASIRGTEALTSSFNLPDYACCVLGRTGWRVARLGFGTSRCGITEPEHREALEKALHGGINLIDTAANYLDGDAESLIGEVLTQLVVWEAFDREGVVVVGKAGYLQGSQLQRAQQMVAEGRGFPEAVQISPAHWHCMHPAFLEDQLTLSLSRMHLDCLDVYLLHNPEYLLSHYLQEGMDREAAEATFYGQIRQAFLALEKLVQEGLIQYYGISSNGFPLPATEARHVSLARVWRAYQDVCLQLGMSVEEGHFGCIQLPYNLLERGAREEKNNPWQGNRVSVLELAKKLGLGVLVNRPLNPIDGGTLVRLAGNAGGGIQEEVTRLIPEQALQGTALQFVLNTPGVDVVLKGMPRPRDVDQAIQVMQQLA